MKRTVLSLIVGALVAFGVAALSGQGDPTPEQKLQNALSKLKQREPQLSTTEKEALPAIQSILTKYFLNRTELLLSEKDIAEAVLKDLNSLVTRGGTKKGALPSFSSMMAESSKPAVAKPTPKPKPSDPKPKPTPTVKPKKFIPGVSSKPTFSPSVSSVAGQQIGVVSMTIAGRTARVVESPAAVEGYSVDRRARLVSQRLTALQAADKLWWTKLGVGREKEQVVVTSPKAPNGVILTADSEWAKQWGVDREALARLVIKNIRSALDPNKAVATRGESTEERRIAAIRLRMEGDAIFETDANGAEAKYRAAIGKDAGYAAPYHRLADLYLKQSRKDDARRILEDALREPQLTNEEKAEIQSRLSGM